MTPLLRLLRPRLRRVDLLVALLLGVLGFAAAVQVRSTQVDGVLASARTQDLVVILDELDARDARLRREVADLSAARDRLTGTGGDEAALAEARRRTQLLGVLAGTLPASGPGVVLTVEDPNRSVRAAVLLDALEELRAAGAEAVQFEGASDGGPTAVRVVAGTDLQDAADGAVQVDGTLLRPPYRYTVIGDAGTLASSLGIPGGVLATVARVGGSARVEQSAALVVGALRPLETPRYARAVPG